MGDLLSFLFKNALIVGLCTLVERMQQQTTDFANCRSGMLETFFF